MKEIKLTQGQVALVDDEDYDWLNQWKWYAAWNKTTKSFYAVRTDYSTGKQKEIRMHRVILNAPKGIDCDHKDGNTLNNQKYNLRLDPEKRNNQNARMRSDNISGYRGIAWDKKYSKWSARINFQGKRYFLGYFDIAKDAAKKRNEEALKLHGEFAKLNVI
jgi:hypothetical protein